MHAIVNDRSVTLPDDLNTFISHFERAKDILKSKDRWIQNAYVRDLSGREINDPIELQKAKVTANYSYNFSLRAAIHSGCHYLHSSYYLAEKLIEAEVGMSMDVWNDLTTTTYEDVIALLYKCIIDLEKLYHETAKPD